MKTSSSSNCILGGRGSPVGKVTKSSITNLIQGSVSKNLQEWLMINCNNKVSTSQDKVPCSVKGICHRQSLSFNWCIPGFCRVCKSASDQGDLPSTMTTEEVIRWAQAMLLEQPKANATPRPICCKASWFAFIKDLHPIGRC